MDQSLHLVTASLLTLFALITIVFALAVIVIIIRHWRFQCRSIGNLLACNSSATILLYAITITIQIPFVVRDDSGSMTAKDTNACKALASLLFYACTVKAYSYLVQAISRFFISVFPQHRFLHSFRANYLLILGSWLVSAMIAAGMLLSANAYQYEPESRLCLMTTKHFVTSFTSVVTVFLTSVTSIIVLYGILLSRTVRYSRTDFNSIYQVQFKRGMKVFRKIFIFVSILLISGTFYGVLVILNAVAHVPPALFSLTILFISFGAAAEAIALLLTNQQVRQIMFAKLNIYSRVRTRRVHPDTTQIKIIHTLPRLDWSHNRRCPSTYVNA